MRILRTTLFGLLAFGLLGVHGSASAALITGVTIEDVSAETGGREAVNTINQSGLTGAAGFGVGTHDDDASNMWQNAGAGFPSTITYDLEDNYVLAGLHVWNYNENNLLGGDDVTILVSPDGLTSNLVSLGAFNFAMADGTATDSGTGVPLGASALLDNVRLVRFVFSTNYRPSNSTHVGLSEVQFDGVAVIPEPSSLLLVGLGMVGLFGYGRRRR